MLSGWVVAAGGIVTQEIRVTLEPDDTGMIGRECPDKDCGRYFKLKFGTGLPTNTCYCPSCGAEGNTTDFFTADQIDFVSTVAAKKIVEPLLDSFATEMEKVNRGQRGGLIQLEFSVKHTGVRLHRYSERQLETDVTCDNCGLEFAVYGVFASCPDCQQLNALKTCLASLETAKKKLVLSRNEAFDVDLRREFVQDALGSAVAAFDSYGKALAAHGSTIHARGKSNLFQDIEALDMKLQETGIPGVEQLIGTSAWEDMKWFFQTRHIYSHNAGVVDDRFVAKQPPYAHMLGQLLPLDADRVEANIEALGLLAARLDGSISGGISPMTTPHQT